MIIFIGLKRHLESVECTEIVNYLLELRRRLISVSRLEVLVHADIGLPSDLIARLRIRNALNHATLQPTFVEVKNWGIKQHECKMYLRESVATIYPRSCGDYFVGKHINIETNILADILENTYNLQR